MLSNPQCHLQREKNWTLTYNTTPPPLPPNGSLPTSLDSTPRLYAMFISKSSMIDLNIDTRLHALYKHSYSVQFFRMKNLMMANVGRNMYFLSSSNKHQLYIHCCVIDCNYPTYKLLHTTGMAHFRITANRPGVFHLS